MDGLRVSRAKRRQLSGLRVLGIFPGESPARSSWVAARHRANDHTCGDYALEMAEA